MKIKVEGLVAARQALTDLQQAKLKVGASFWLGRQVRAITPVVQDFEKHQLELIQQHGVPAQRPDTWTIDPSMPGWPAFYVGLREMLDQEVEPQPLSFLGETLEISSADLLALDFLFTWDNVVE